MPANAQGRAGHPSSPVGHLACAKSFCSAACRPEGRAVLRSTRPKKPNPARVSGVFSAVETNTCFRGRNQHLSGKKLLDAVTSASLLVTRALLLVARSY